MITTNQIQDTLGRIPTPEEVSKYQNASIGDLLLYKNSKPIPGEGATSNIDYIDTSAPKGTQADLTGAVLPNNGVNGDTRTPNTVEAGNSYKDQHDAALKSYQDIQKQVADIDKALNDSYINKKREIEAQGGIVNDTQLRAQIANEQAPLISHRKTLASSQSIASKQLSDSQASFNQEANRLNQAKLQSERLKQAGDQFNARQTQQSNQFDATLDQRGDLADKRIEATNDLQDKRALQAQALVNLRASLQGTNQDITPELASAIARGEVDASKITSRSIKIYNDLAKLSVDAVSSALTAKQRSQTITQAAKYQTAAAISSGVLEKNMPIIIDLASKVNVNDVPGINSAYIKGAAYASKDPNITKYVSILNTLRSEYANLISKGGVSTESTREDAVHAIPAGLTAEQYTGLKSQLEQESKNIIGQAQDVIDSAKSNQSLGSTEQTKIDTRVQPSGTIITDKKGKKYKVGADGQTLTPL